jgi:hypothetical protein
MKIQLTLRGGIYGTVTLETLDSENLDVDIPARLLRRLAADKMRRFEPDQLGAEPQESFATEQETYELSVGQPDGTTKRYEIPKPIADADPDLQQVMKLIWSMAKPVGDV